MNKVILAIVIMIIVIALLPEVDRQSDSNAYQVFSMDSFIDLVTGDATRGTRRSRGRTQNIPSAKMIVQSSPLSLTFHQAFTFDTILPNTPPSEKISRLSARISPGERESLTFTMRSSEMIPHLEVKSSDLVGSPGTIPSSALDIRVVKVWDQAGLGVSKETRVKVPELLVYDDSQILKGVVTSDSYTPPSLKESFHTSLQPQSTKQIWIIVDIPQDTRPGKYTGKLSIDAGKTVKDLPLSIEILPIKLADVPQETLMFFRPDQELWQKDDKDLKLQLLDIKKAGFRGISLDDHKLDESSLRSLLQIAKEVGLGPKVIAFDLKNKELIRSYGFDPVFYGNDEPNTDVTMTWHLYKSARIHKEGEKVFTSILIQKADRLDNPQDSYYDLVDPTTSTSFRQQGLTGEGLDWANYHSNYLDRTQKSADAPLMNYINAWRAGTSPKRSRTETMYWQIWQEKPIWNRMMAGTFLSTTPLEGIIPYVYQERVIPLFGDPFDDFDNDESTHYRDLFTTYPSQNGPIPTTKWVAIGEGNDDLRYLITFDEAMDTFKQTDPQRAAKLLEQKERLLEPHKDPANYKTITGKDFIELREFLIDSILEMNP